MRDDISVRFTSREVPRDTLHALMTRSDAPALVRAVWHLGMLVVGGWALWRLRFTPWVLPLLVGIYALIMLQNPKVKAGFAEIEGAIDEEEDEEDDDEKGDEDDDED